MREKILILAFSLFVFLGQSQNLTPRFEAKYSETISLLRFMEAAAKVSHFSPSYRKIILTKFGENDPIFNALLADFQSITLDYNYKWESYPDTRHSQRSTYDLLNIAAVNAKNLSDFSSRIIGILPNEDFIKLINCLERGKPFHDLLFADYGSKIKKQVKQYKPFQKQLGGIFSQVSQFYGTKWAADVPFVVCLYPIPMQKGTSSATPHGNTLICAFLADNKNDYKNRLAVVTHEMCHILYDGQSADNQRNIERWMNQNPSKYKNLAYQYFDEGMATALGNGWAYEVMNNRVDTSSWYNDDIINGYGHALFPLVKSYIRAKKTMDSTFVNEAIEIFAKTFPKAIYDYNVMLNDVFMSGSFPDSLKNATIKIVADHFRMTSRSLSTPLLDEQTIAEWNSTKAARVLFFNENIKENWAYLKEKDALIAQKFGNIQGFPSTGQYFSFLSEQGQATLILFYDNLAMLEKMLLQIKKERYIDQNQALHQLK
jgi:hypothetical protein